MEDATDAESSVITPKKCSQYSKYKKEKYNGLKKLKKGHGTERVDLQINSGNSINK